MRSAEGALRIFIPLLVRLLAVAVICLAGSVVWSMIDARRGLERENADTSDRTGQHIAALYRQELRWRGGVSKERLLPTPEWRTLQTLALISPGVCVDFRFAQEVPERLCGQVVGVGSAAPAWFAAAYDWTLGTRLKGGDPREFAAAARTVARGGRALAPEIARAIAVERIRGGSILDALGPREAEILRQIAIGASDFEIARSLNPSSQDRAQRPLSDQRQDRRGIVADDRAPAS